MSIYVECRHIKVSGEKCCSPAIRNTHYCYFHTRLNRPAVPQQQPAVQDELLEFTPLEDRSAIQIALSRVIGAIATGKLDPKRAGLLLYGLQIASQNAADKFRIVSVDAVETMTHTASGQELGPIKVCCDEPGDCKICPRNNICDDPDRDDWDEIEGEELASAS